MSEGLSVRRLLEKARKYFESGKFLHSFQLYHKIIEQNPEIIEAYIDLAFFYSKLGKERSAEKLLLRAHEIDPQNEEVIFTLGNHYLKMERYDDAINFYTKIADRNYPVVHYNLALAYYYKGELLEAEAEFKHVLKLDPEFPRAIEAIAEILIKRENYDEAIEYIRRGFKKEPYNYVLYYLYTLALWNKGRLDEAKKAIETAIDLEPERAILWEICGEILLELGRIDEAEEYFKKALKLDSKLVDSYINLGLIYTYRNNEEEAESYFKQALKIDPNAKSKIEEKLNLLKNG